MNAKFLLKLAFLMLVILLIAFIPFEFNWPELQLFGVLYFLYLVFIMAYFLKNDPRILENRTRFVLPKQGWDRLIMAAMAIFMAAFVWIAWIDRVERGFSIIPVWLEALGFIGIIKFMAINFLVMKENPYAAKVIEIQKERGQKVISTGPYAYVRHPMYLGMFIFFASLPIALGSYYALVPALGIVAVVLIRIPREEEVLAKGLAGYKAYMKKVKWRIVPRIW